MHCVKADYPDDWNEARIHTLADLHIGDPQCDYAECCNKIDEIKNDPHGLCILNGDLVNTVLRNSVGDIYGEKLPPMKQIDEIVTLLRPIKDKIIGADTGNHEARVYKSDGIDMMRLICRELGIEERYAPEAVLIFLRFGKQSPHARHTKEYPNQRYVIYATHGTGNGRKEGSKIIRLSELAAIVDADVYIHSHSHLPIITKEAYYRIDPIHNNATLIDKLFVNTAAAMNYGGYGQEKAYKPSSKANPIITLQAKERLASATL